MTNLSSIMAPDVGNGQGTSLAQLHSKHSMVLGRLKLSRSWQGCKDGVRKRGQVSHCDAYHECQFSENVLTGDEVQNFEIQGLRAELQRL